MTIHPGCTNVTHNELNCPLAGLTPDEWCESCLAHFGPPRPTPGVVIPIRRVSTPHVVDLHRFEDDGGPVYEEVGP